MKNRQALKGRHKDVARVSLLLVALAEMSLGAEPDLLLYYPCDEKSGTILHDAGPYHKDGSLNAVVNGEERGVTIVCKNAGEWVPIINQDGIQRKGIVPGSDSALAEGDRPIVLDRDKDYAIDCTNGLVKVLDGGRIEPGNSFTLDFRFANPGPQWVEGKKGGAIKLDGLDDFVSLGQPDLSSKPTSLTIELWVLLPKEMPVDAVITIQSAVGNPKSNATTPSRASSKQLTPRAWHHLAATLDDKTTTYFLDGKSVLVRKPGLGDLLRSVQIGGTRDPFFFAGLIDEIKIYGRARTAEEIAKDAAQ